MIRLVLTGIDQEKYDDPKHYRLVCFTEDGGKLAIWGRNGETENVKKVRAWIGAVGFPLAVVGSWKEPAGWATTDRIGHTHWLEESTDVQRG